ncbi:MAG: hypothetical protein KAI66_21230 [Lentisphaeria bacterium]|nr:hypothetical protein [Lentisphaeria bacterium]
MNARLISELEHLDVVWQEPSRDSSGSMPLGNGDVGINLWVEPGGDLLFYISKTDAWSGNGRLLKLGLVRVSLKPNPFAEGAPFVQRLRLLFGDIEIVAGSPGREVKINAWVDAHHPVIQVHASSATLRTALTVTLEPWRTERRNLTGGGAVGAHGLAGRPEPIVVDPDKILQGRRNKIVWYHRNTFSIYPKTLRAQGLGKSVSKHPGPLLNRRFGGVISGSMLRTVDDHTLRSTRPVRHHETTIHVHGDVCELEETWEAGLRVSRLGSGRSSSLNRQKRHWAWWRDFWERSWIFADTRDKEVQPPDGVCPLSRGYALQRFINACRGRGGAPIKFNGNVFTVDTLNATNENQRFDADFDWIPDQDHGAVSMNALQRMLLQCEGDSIRILPAWPPEWSVEFKLRAPRDTTVHVRWRDGILENLTVTPEARRADVVLPPFVPRPVPMPQPTVEMTPQRP